ncbi:MAG: hypothetical protein RIC18_06530 [Hoeflea sp.]|uniref:hypothetical protein n=1 Tax=Hoeflea sp. TaxID=1940281 RepID=UPI0032ECEDF0
MNPLRYIIGSSLLGAVLLGAGLLFVGLTEQNSTEAVSTSAQRVEFTYKPVMLKSGKCQPNRIALADWKQLNGIAEIHGEITFNDIKSGQTKTERLRAAFNREDANGIAISNVSWGALEDAPCSDIKISQVVTHCLYRSTRQDSKRNSLFRAPGSRKNACPEISTTANGYASISVVDESQALASH